MLKERPEITYTMVKYFGDKKMPNREDESYLNEHGHSPNCSCPECIRKRKRIPYPFPAEFECPACGNISLYFSDNLAKYKCVHEPFKAEGKTIKEIADKKAKIDKQMKDIFNQLNNP
jgi:hypothetical protein